MSYALITGGSKGIGKAIAMQLASRKYDILLVARNEKDLQTTAAEISALYQINVKYLSVDLSNTAAAETVFQWCKTENFTVQILVNNAGYGIAGRFENAALSEHLNMLQVNIISLVSLTHQFIPLLKMQEQSYLLNVASSSAYQSTPGIALYAASKALVLNFSRSLSIELADTPVSVTCVCPGGTDTTFVQRARVGQKALKLADKVNMQPKEVAAIAVKGMFAGKTEVVTGGLNKLGVFLAWLLPKKLIEKSAGKIYEI